MTFDHLPWSAPASRASQPAVRDETTALSSGELTAWIEAVAEQFAEQGVGRQDVVAIMLSNRVELLVAMFAAWRLGAVATPVNPTFTASEAEYQIADADASLVVIEQEGAPVAGRPTITAAGLRRTVEGVGPGEPATRADDTALLIYTSGSTGRPKGVVLNHANLDAMTSSIGGHMELSHDDHCLLVLPLFHVNAICVSVLAPLSVGGQVSVLSRFSPTTFLEAIERLRPTYFSAVPTIYSHLVTLPEDVVVDTSSLRFGVCGAAPAPTGLLARVEDRFGFPVLEGYGLTEGTCASSVNPLHGARKAGTVGVALPGQTIAIVRPDGSFADAGERGEVVIRGPIVMQRYLNRPEETAATVVDGWLHTGDVGVLDEDGYLTLVDRIKDMIIRGGENLYPKEIEHVLQSHPAVLDAAVVGAPHAVYGEVPVAYVVAQPGASVDLADLESLCRERLTKVKIPTAIHVLDDLPKNPVGKTDKPALRLLADPARRPVTVEQGA